MNTETYREREERIMRLVMELVRDWPPRANIAPVRELVTLADKYGWRIVPAATIKPTEGER